MSQKEIGTRKSRENRHKSERLNSQSFPMKTRWFRKCPRFLREAIINTERKIGVCSLKMLPYLQISKQAILFLSFFFTEKTNYNQSCRVVSAELIESQTTSGVGEQTSKKFTRTLKVCFQTLTDKWARILICLVLLVTGSSENLKTHEETELRVNMWEKMGLGHWKQPRLTRFSATLFCSLLSIQEGGGSWEGRGALLPWTKAL